MKLKMFSAMLAAAFLSIPVLADDSLLGHQSDMVQMLLKFDTNGDGIISRDEMLAGKTAEFNAADTNTDTYLSWSEYKTLLDSKQTARLESIFDVMDADNNGSATAEEFAAAFADKPAAQTTTVFKLMAGEDTALTLDELKAATAEAAAKDMWKFASMDKDADGQISLTEYTEMPSKPAKPTKPVGGKPSRH